MKNIIICIILLLAAAACKKEIVVQTVQTTVQDTITLIHDSLVHDTLVVVHDSLQLVHDSILVVANKNEENKTKYFEKLTNGKAVKIACEGTSLTYGYGVDNYPGINGSTVPRAAYQYPETLAETLASMGIPATVVNRGFPGDMAINGIIRWLDSTSADAVIIEYASNEAFAGMPATGRFKESLTECIERRIRQGAWVILCNPPNMIGIDNTALNALQDTTRNLGKAFNCDVFEVQNSLKSLGNYLFDGIHPTKEGYQKWGIDISKILQ